MTNAIPASAHMIAAPVHDLAAAWNQHAVERCQVDPATELLAVPVTRPGRKPGWRPAFRVPATSTLVIVHTASPHASPEQARQCLADLLTAMAAEGSIILQPEIAA
ncbi:hypothetical protein [Halomonas organivorans]|uniref:Uncharacterized protein n=1 Tax=Halomonas organivorans TaxID=257772 RepID=A0A7W5G722_9GAMM|nr:hypothetical protein [Halomonas organivorans]MBB3142790.1 hypothetical protein [Halomonas organivorans]